MAEQLDLTAPITYPSTTYYKVAELRLQRESPSSIYVRLKGTNGEHFDHLYEGATALNLIIALNKANLTTNSLEKRILNQLITDGFLSGTVSGSPD
jgi:hypothetical protein